MGVPIESFSLIRVDTEKPKFFHKWWNLRNRWGIHYQCVFVDKDYISYEIMVVESH